PTLAPLEIVSGEEGDYHQPLERHRQVPPHHLAQLVGLALAGQHIAFQFFVVLQLDLEEARQLQRRARRASDRDGRMLVGLEHLVDAPSGDLEPLGRLAVAGHQYAALEPDRQHGGAVGNGRKPRDTGRAGGGRLGAARWGLGKRLRPPARQEVIETGTVRIEEARHSRQAFNFSSRTSWYWRSIIATRGSFHPQPFRSR